ncbi:hypothetical protein GCM10010277_78920 [Streptomyces longisporoflavus]|nr:hypothetical protein GCM10010277_78920 [Streptomyces longisporoflavus]
MDKKDYPTGEEIQLAVEAAVSATTAAKHHFHRLRRSARHHLGFVAARIQPFLLALCVPGFGWAAAQRELDSAERPAEVLNWLITAQPNRRAQAARKRSTVSGTSFVTATANPPATPVADRSQPQSLQRGR